MHFSAVGEGRERVHLSAVGKGGNRVHCSAVGEGWEQGALQCYRGGVGKGCTAVL